MFFSEKKRHRQPRSLSFGNCGWEGPLWLVRQSGQSDSPFPESQAGTRRLKEERHQAELDCLLLWTVRQGGRLNCFAAVHFFPFSLPCLLSLLPADSGGSLCSSPWKPPQLEGRVSEVCGLIFISLDTLSSSPAANGSRKESIKEKIGGTWWFVVFFLGYLVVSESCWDRAQGSTRQVARVASNQERQQGFIASRAWHPIRADKLGEPSNEPPVMWHSLQQDLQDIWGLLSRSCCSIHGALPASCQAV